NPTKGRRTRRKGEGCSSSSGLVTKESPRESEKRWACALSCVRPSIIATSVRCLSALRNSAPQQKNEVAPPKLKPERSELASAYDDLKSNFQVSFETACK